MLFPPPLPPQGISINLGMMIGNLGQDDRHLDMP